MRRKILGVAIGTAATLLASSAMGAVDRRLIERRLLGTWRSDNERTTARWKCQKELTPEVQERFERNFGKLTFRFTKTHIYTEFEDVKDVVAYSVVAHDSSSVVIARHEDNERSLQQIHFDGEGFCVHSGYNVEFYKRIA